MRVKHNVFSAQGMTRNYGIEKARGEWIAFLDDDDFYVENKIEIQLEAMKKNNMLFSTTKMYLIDHKTLSMDKLDFTVVCLNNDIDKENKIITLDMIHKQNHVSNSTVIIHHSIVKKTGLQNIIPHGEEDWDYWKRAIQYTQCLFLAIPLIYYTLRVGGYRKPTHYH